MTTKDIKKKRVKRLGLSYLESFLFLMAGYWLRVFINHYSGPDVGFIEAVANYVKESGGIYGFITVLGSLAIAFKNFKSAFRYRNGDNRDPGSGQNR